MKTASLIDRLMMFGMTRQEAQIYLCLAQNNELSGYEVSKITGISRSNVYSALARLVEEGAAYLLEGNANKYVSVDVSEFCQNKIRHLTETKESLKRDMPQLKNTCDGYITISGHQHIMDRIHYMLENVVYRVYISMPITFLEQFREDIMKLLTAEKKVVLIISQPQDYPGSIQYITDRQDMQLRLIVDSEYVLTGDMTGSADDTCLYCGQPNFVNVFKEAMGNEIKLIELKGNKS